MSTTNARIGLGSFPFASPFTKVSEDQAEAIVNRFLELGGTHIDTAPTYAQGAVERLLGRVLFPRHRSRVTIATSCGYVRTPEGGYRVSGKYDDVLADCEESLARLGTDYLDVYYSHIPDLETPFEETIRGLRHLRERGLIRGIGVSNVTISQLESYNRDGDVGFVQNRFSPVNRGIETAFLEYCQAHNIRIVAYQVLERGLLTNAGASGLTFRPGDLRSSKPEFAETVHPRLAQWVRTYVLPLAEARALPLSALSIWWALQLPHIGAVQCGATRPQQVDEFMQGATLGPDAGLLADLEAAYRLLEDQIGSRTKGTVRGFMGLESYDVYKGSATGQSPGPSNGR